MASITVGRENSTSIDLYYEDHGAGPPVVLISAFPLSGRIWERQIEALLNEGHRVIVYDRRGFGRSSQPFGDCGFDILAADLNTMMVTLDIQQATLIGHSMGSGEVVRYLSAHGSRRVTNAILISPLQPFLLRGADNPLGIDGSVFEQMLAQLGRDRLAFLADFLDRIFSTDPRAPAVLNALDLQFFWNDSSTASPSSTADCLTACLTDFRRDLERVDVPVLAIGGAKDQLTPVEATVALLPHLLQSCTTEIVADAPHGLVWTHADDVNRLVLTFIDG
jgi:non-heme chloroperoxidase